MRFTVQRYQAPYGRTRYWAVYDPFGGLVCVCVYKRGAEEVARRFNS